MYGTYSGLYSKGLITLAINYISGSTASGYNLHKGLRRNINGPVELKGGQLNFVLKEPGGNPYDGTFYLSLDTASLKITGKWIPVDSTKAHAGPLALSKKQGTEERGYDLWYSDLGHLFFSNDGTCRLEYYPSADSSNSQMITVRGNYEGGEDSIRIDWQRNNRTPVLNMRLVKKPGVEGTDSTEGHAPQLQGNGVTFTKNMAG